MKKLILSFGVTVLFGLTGYGQPIDFARADFRKADSIARLYPHYSLRDMKALSDKLTRSLITEEEKFRAIYRWVCDNIDYDRALYLQNKKQREKNDGAEALGRWNKRFSIRVFKTLLEKQRTICTGYAYLLKELAGYAGISCKIVDGYGRTIRANIGGTGNANHSWNAVRVNNRWYLCDPTWSAGAYDTQLSAYEKKFNPSYFLADPTLFVRNHYPLDTAWMLIAAKPTLKEFLEGPVIYSEAFPYAVHPLFPETLEVTTARGQNVSFRFAGNQRSSLPKATLQVERSNVNLPVGAEVSADKIGRYCIDRSFTSRGIYAVHVLLDGNYVWTYRVRVE